MCSWRVPVLQIQVETLLAPFDQILDPPLFVVNVIHLNFPNYFHSDVQANTHRKAKPPYGDECAESCPFSGVYKGASFNFMGCLKTCMQVAIQTACNCTDLNYKDFMFCSIDDCPGTV